MILRKNIKNFFRRIWYLTPWKLYKDLNHFKNKLDKLEFIVNNQFLQNVNGVLHVGASTGQERDMYENLDLEVLWVEPIDEVYLKLCENIKSFKNQKAIQALLTDSNEKVYNFYITNNNGESSSIFHLNLHKNIWPKVKLSRTIKLKSITLQRLIAQQRIDIQKYDSLVMDTQGSELLILKGAGELIRNFKFIKTEVADFESYLGCCQFDQIDEFMSSNCFKLISKNIFAKTEKGGKYYDVIYMRI